MAAVAFTCAEGFDKLSLSDQVWLLGKPVQIWIHSPEVLIADLPDGLEPDSMAAMLSMIYGVQVELCETLPRQQSRGADAMTKAQEKAIEEDMDRLLREYDLEMEFIRGLSEPRVDISLEEPISGCKVPLNKPIWQSVFRKPSPVIDLQHWLATGEADEYVYVPNDASKSIVEAEDTVSNSMYTEVLVNAYKKMAKRLGINPLVKMLDGITVPLMNLTPMWGTQPHPVGERSARLANSTLVDFDDSAYASDYITAICDLECHEFEKEPIRKRVLAKVEHILMGRTSHTYNQRFVHNLYEKLMHQSVDSAWAQNRIGVTNTVLGILKQMLLEGVVMEDSMDMFITRLNNFGYAKYQEDFEKLFESCKVGNYISPLES